eukprot:364349-Chlamydomonas_euryale.AAC.8
MVRLWAHAAGVAGKTLQERWERWESVGTSEGAERRHETDNRHRAGRSRSDEVRGVRTERGKRDASTTGGSLKGALAPSLHTNQQGVTTKGRRACQGAAAALVACARASLPPGECSAAPPHRNRHSGLSCGAAKSEDEP